MTWNLRLVENNNSVEIRKVYYEIMGMPISHTTFSYDGTNQAEINRLEKMVDEAYTKPILKFAS
jgi:hypothetical protein